MTLKRYQMNSDQYFKFERDCEIYQFRGQETEFMVVGVEADREMASKMHSTFNNFEFKFAHVEVQMPDSNEIRYTDCYFGNILKHGDIVLGYDLKSMKVWEEMSLCNNQKVTPDVVLIRKHYPEKLKKRKLWKLERMEVEKDFTSGGKKLKRHEKEQDQDLEEFMEDLEQNKGMRQRINLIRVRGR